MDTFRSPYEQPTTLFLGSAAVQRGLLSRSELRRPPCRRVWRDVYVVSEAPSDEPLDHLTRLRALALLMPRWVVFSGASAALVHGADVARRDDPVEVTVQRGYSLTPRNGVEVRHGELVADDVTTMCGIRLTTPIRTAFDLARRPARGGNLTEHVVAVDALTALPEGAVSPEGLAAYADDERFNGWRGVRQVARVAHLAEPLAGSPEESRLRMRLMRGGLPRPVAQYQLDVAGRRFFLDLAYPGFRIAVEYDGECHAERREADAERHDRITAAGWTHVVHTRALYRPGAPDPVAQVRRALIERGWRPHSAMGLTDRRN